MYGLKSTGLLTYALANLFLATAFIIPDEYRHHAKLFRFLLHFTTVRTSVLWCPTKFLWCTSMVQRSLFWFARSILKLLQGQSWNQCVLQIVVSATVRDSPSFLEQLTRIIYFVFQEHWFLSYDQLWAALLIGRNAVTWHLLLSNAEPCRRSTVQQSNILNRHVTAILNRYVNGH